MRASAKFFRTGNLILLSDFGIVWNSRFRISCILYCKETVWKHTNVYCTTQLKQPHLIFNGGSHNRLLFPKSVTWEIEKLTGTVCNLFHFMCLQWMQPFPPFHLLKTLGCWREVMHSLGIDLQNCKCMKRTH